MIAEIALENVTIKVDLSQPLDISIPLRAGDANVRAWYVDPITIEPVRTDRFTGSVAEGGTVNFRNIAFNPHGNGTHTECVGHIAKDVFSINRTLTRFFFKALVITIDPETLQEDEGEFKKVGDRIITADQLKTAIGSKRPEALVLRTNPNHPKKLNRHYDNSNWPYLTEEAAALLNRYDIAHFLIDLPSVDREFDGGKMLAHRAFWNYPENPRMYATISEMIYVEDEIKDGTYLLNLQISSFENDAAPSKPILYKCI